METRTPRHDGWTIDRQIVFLTRFAVTRSVSKAAAAAGMSRQGAYGFRWSAAGDEFDRAWTRILRLPPRRANQRRANQRRANPRRANPRRANSFRQHQSTRAFGAFATGDKVDTPNRRSPLLCA